MDGLGDWTSWVKLIVGAGIGSALVQGLLPFIRDHYQRKKQAAYMAMRLAVVLENFAWACANLILANGSAETPPDDECPAWDVNLPELPPYPDDPDGWRAIDRRLAGRCLGLRNRLQESQSGIRIAIDFFNDDEEIKITADHEGAKRGLEAWDIAVALRRKHDVEDVAPEWDYVDFLRRALKSAEEQRVAHRKAAYSLHVSGQAQSGDQQNAQRS